MSWFSKSIKKVGKSVSGGIKQLGRNLKKYSPAIAGIASAFVPGLGGALLGTYANYGQAETQAQAVGGTVIQDPNKPGFYTVMPRAGVMPAPAEAQWIPGIPNLVVIIVPALFFIAMLFLFVLPRK